MTALLVFLGAAAGASLRHLTDHVVRSRHDGPFPWGTLGANVVGSLVLGALAGVGTALPHPVFAVAGIGFCGALTTYSTFGYDTVRLAERGAYRNAAAYVAVTVAAGVGAAMLAHATTNALY